MPALVTPDVRYRVSFLAAMAEFAAEGRAGDGSMVGNDIERFSASWEQADGFAAYVARLRQDAVEPRHADMVRCTSLWWVDAEEYVGRVAVRHELNDWLREWGGHIGYDVRRSRRGEGHATALLAATLPVAHGLGIDPALVTCDPDNVASRRTIERNGGVPDGERQGKLRFWLPTAPRRPAV